MNKLTFKGVGRLIEHAANAPETAPLYGDETGRGLWLVGDHGVYLMSNGRPEMDKSGDQHVVYAETCNPETQDFDDWWFVKNETFGADDGVEFIALDGIAGAATLTIEFAGDTLKISGKRESDE